jgi:hypothetical protein
LPPALFRTNIFEFNHVSDPSKEFTYQDKQHQQNERNTKRTSRRRQESMGG